MGGNRLIGIDLARFVALIGMFAMHTLPRVDEYHDPTWVVYLWAVAAPLFMVLAGVGYVLAEHNKKDKNTSSSITIRACLIGVIGLSLFALDTDVYIILVHFAVMFMVALPVRSWSAKRLGVLSCSLFLLGPLAYWITHQVFAGIAVDYPHYPYPEGWELFDFLVGVAYPLFVWSIYFFVGMFLGRLVADGKATKKFWVRLLGMGAFAWVLTHQLTLGALTASYHVDNRDELLPNTTVSDAELVGTLGSQPFEGVYPEESPLWFVLSMPYSDSYVNVINALGWSALVVSGCMLLSRLTVLQRSNNKMRKFFVGPLVGAGQSALTLYVLHLVVIHAFRALDVSGFGFMSYEWALFTVIVLFTLLVGVFVSVFDRRAPVEAFLRFMTMLLISDKSRKDKERITGR